MIVLSVVRNFILKKEDSPLWRTAFFAVLTLHLEGFLRDIRRLSLSK